MQPIPLYASDIKSGDFSLVHEPPHVSYNLKVGRVQDAIYEPRISGNHPLLEVFMVLVGKEYRELYVARFKPQNLVIIESQDDIESAFIDRKHEFISQCRMSDEEFKAFDGGEYQKHLKTALEDYEISQRTDINAAQYVEPPVIRM
ncbi:MAG: hypothetical protein QMD85_04790 [Candidatus Aenigmarchaeota archaeon]|nr:hypothetical protein [Candidatus Aenigmarchaeota archaeon]